MSLRTGKLGEKSADGEISKSEKRNKVEKKQRQNGRRKRKDCRFSDGGGREGVEGESFCTKEYKSHREGQAAGESSRTAACKTSHKPTDANSVREDRTLEKKKRILEKKISQGRE